MTPDEIRKRLAGRAAEYVMFMDDGSPDEAGQAPSNVPTKSEPTEAHDDPSTDDRCERCHHTDVTALT